MSDGEKLLTEDDMTALALARARVGAFTEDEYFEIVQWAERVKTDGIFLSLILAGKVGVTVKDGEATIHR